MTNLDSTLKSRDITLPIELHIVKAMVFPLVIYGCENWTIKKAEHRRINDFKLWCWRILLRVPWTARRSNQSILKEINPECSLKRLILKLKFKYFSHQIWRAYWKDLDTRKDWRKRRSQHEKMRWLDSIPNSMDMNLSKLGDIGGQEPGMLQSMGWKKPYRT